MQYGLNLSTVKRGYLGQRDNLGQSWDSLEINLATSNSTVYGQLTVTSVFVRL